MNKEILAANLHGDKKGLPDWYTHFGSKAFSRSAIPAFAESVAAVYPKGPLTVVGLGSGNASYEIEVSKQMREKGWRPTLVISELQEGSLQRIPPSIPADRQNQDPIMIARTRSDSTRLPLPTERGNTLVLSRAIEHYLPEKIQKELIEEAGRVLQPGELYVAQLSSGESLAMGALSAGLKAVANKEVSYLDVATYENRVESVRQPDGSPVFKRIHKKNAQTQAGRGVLDQARRYLNQEFLKMYESESGGSYDHYLHEIEEITQTRESLGREVWSGEKTRELGIKELDATISGTEAFALFRNIYVSSIENYLREEGVRLSDELKVPGFHMIKGFKGVKDIKLDVAYPVVVWQKQPQK